jgi:hypothetical protein
LSIPRPISLICVSPYPFLEQAKSGLRLSLFFRTTEGPLIAITVDRNPLNQVQANFKELHYKVLLTVYISR